MKSVTKHHHLIIVYIFLLFLYGMGTGCQVGKEYKRPATELPTQYRGAPETADSAGIAATPWKIFFAYPELEELIDSAIAKNYDLQLAIRNMESARLTLQQAKLGQLPDIVFQATASSTRSSDNSLNGISAQQFLGTSHVEDYNANIGLTWEADIWGKIRSRKEAALADYLQTTEARKAVQTQLVSDVAQGFYNLLMLDDQLAVARKNVMLNDSTLRIIRLQYDAGQVTALAIEQADAQRHTAALLVPQLEQSIQIQENALRILAGELPSSINRNMSIDNLDVPERFSAGVPASLLGQRPDVQAMEFALQAANARVGVAKANMYPSLVITANAGVNSFQFANWFSVPASLFGMAAGGLTQPIFQRKQLKTQYELAMLEREKSVIRFRQSVLNAVGEVSNALVKLEKLKEQRVIASERTDTLQLATRNAGLLFKSGMANYLEVLTAQGAALQSELETVDLKRQHLNSFVELYRSLGGGWK
ncbi:MAG TPA: efflux transporter outer membrane subunit [Puia sp.]|nr:efflux transporter outer membrane subunit [Puia sp.]